ncbi:MAG: radical SAM protein [Gemmatimonadetes bacterium]|nr:radical SAM protein [Gemmatimonadota bacterium]
MSVAAADARIRRLRPPKPRVDPYTAHGALVEDERRPDGRRETALTIFLAGAECPFTCSFCDLWRYTIDGPTPPGALAAQVEKVLNASGTPLPDRLKLYNASNFFDRRAVPLADRDRLAALAGPFAAVTVESHVNTIGTETLAFARSLRGRLEVAVGLETIHPEASRRLNKRLELPRFDAAARLLAENGIDLRVFVLVGAPHVPPAESVAWTIRTVEYAVTRGASVVAIIPVRGGNGEMERLKSLGEFSPPTLAQLEAALDGCLQFTGCVVTADSWDAEQFAPCDACRPARIERLQRINVRGRAESRVACAVCGAA